jgi:hypothetical protein
MSMGEISRQLHGKWRAMMSLSFSFMRALKGDLPFGDLRSSTGGTEVNPRF